MKNRYLRGMAIASFIIIISFANFNNLEGSDCIRAIHIVTLLICGMGIGVFLTNFFHFLMEKRSK
ncbi:MAG: hypothetical protein ABI204_06425 [Ginsengibacter sp.]